MLKSRRILRTALAALALHASCNFPANALTFERAIGTSSGARIIAKGPIERGDAERLQAFVRDVGRMDVQFDVSTGKRSIAPRDDASAFSDGLRILNGSENRATVEFSSGGGNMVAGIELGWYIRQLGFNTLVPGNVRCASACTFAFLGGVSRTVEGLFLVHAMGTRDELKPDEVGAALDGVQYLAAQAISFTRDMTGSAAMAEKAFSVSARTIVEVDDDELRDMNIITEVVRPSQGFPTDRLGTLNCATGSSPELVRKTVCNDLDLARLEVRITTALRKLKEGPGLRLAAQQPQWTAYRDRCAEAVKGYAPRLSVEANPVLGNMRLSLVKKGLRGVRACLTFAYEKRVSELEAFVTYAEIAANPEVLEGWKK